MYGDPPPPKYYEEFKKYVHLFVVLRSFQTNVYGWKEYFDLYNLTVACQNCQEIFLLNYLFLQKMFCVSNSTK